VAAVITSAGSALVARRCCGSRYEGYWEFPGGKIEPDETPIEAARREIMEELGVEIQVLDPKPFVSVVWNYDHARVHLVALRSRINSGTPVPLIHSEIRWVPVAELEEMEVLPADRPVAAALVTLMAGSV
jgi:8-oxo-dGTP diphosphatase